MNKSILVLLLTFPLIAFAQDSKGTYVNTQAPDTIVTMPKPAFVTLDQMPKYPGGNQAMARFLMNNIVYPDDALNYGVEGKVYLTFTVDSIGKLVDIKTIKGIGYGCEEEAIRVLNLMPNWIPGKQDGEPVSVKFHLPLRFNFPEEVEEDSKKNKRKK